MKLRARQQARFSALYVAVAIVVLVFLQSWLLAPQAQEIPMSRLVEWVREGRVARVSFGEREIRGVLKEPLQGAQAPAPDWLARFTGWTPGTLIVVVRIPGADDAPLLRELEAHKVEFSGRIDSTLVRDLIFGWLLPIGVMAAIWIFLMRRMGGGPTQALTFGRSKVKIYDRKELKTTFADVAGVDEAKAELMEVVDFLRNPQKYQRLGGRIPKGVLIVGPPGSGKTLLARAVAGEADVPFFFLSGSEFVEMFVGVGAARVRDLFEQAKEKAPCIVFIDELDAIGKSRAGATGFVGGHDEREQTLNQLLVEMDGFDASKGVIIMAATNRPEVLDAALLRPGRFDRQVVVDRPDVRGREAILRVHARHVRLAPEVSLQVIAARTPGFAGADLANIVNEAALLAARKGKDAVEQADLEEAIDRVVAGHGAPEPRALGDRARHRRPPRDGPRPGGVLGAPRRPGAQGDDHPAGGGGARHDLPAADGGPLPPAALELEDRIAVLARRARGGGARVRRALDRGAQRPRAGDGAGARHGRCATGCRSGSARSPSAADGGPGFLRRGGPGWEGGRARVQRGDRPRHRRGGPAHRRGDVRPGAGAPRRQEADACSGPPRC